MNSVARANALKDSSTLYIIRRRVFFCLWSLIAAGYSVFAVGPSSSATHLESLGQMLASSTFEADYTSFLWVRPGRLDGTGSMTWHAGVFLGRPKPGAFRDVFVADFQVTSDKKPRKIRRLTNLSRTRDGDEDILVGDKRGRISFATSRGGQYRTVALVDFTGEPDELTAQWTWQQRLANRITNFQRTGRMKGAHWRHYIFSDPPHQLTLRFRTETLEVGTSLNSFEIDANGDAHSQAVVKQEMVKARPAMLAWSVDTVRAVPWIGPRKIEWLEKYWFKWLDWLARMQYTVIRDAGDFAPPGPVGKTGIDRPSGLPDWPPPNIEPRLSPAIDNEGRWYPVDDDLFAVHSTGPSLFYSLFLRIDPERPFARVYMTAWDPARVEIHMVAGVLEPVSSTGLRGTGEVPRVPERDHVSRLVGAFNGAFQALHGEWGMVLDRKALLPPKPFGATVALLDDGRTGMGTWPNPGDELPEELVDLRQNLPPLVEGGVVNPYQLKWWGAVPQDFADRIFTIRTGLCMTRTGKLIYFWGDHLSGDTLGEAMIGANCDYGIHLDMNPGHSGFEYYRVDPVDNQPKLARKLKQDVEAEGLVPRRNDLFFRARKLSSEMRHMRFPRYIGRDPRDFFYLLRRKSIFDRPLSLTDAWIPIAPEAAVPVAAVSHVLKDGSDLYKIDPRQTEFSIEREEPSGTLAAIPFSTSKSGVSTGLILEGEALEALRPGEPAIKLEPGRVVLLRPGEQQNGKNMIQGVPKTIAEHTGTSAVVAVDPDGFVLVVRTQSANVGDIYQTLKKLSSTPAIALLPPETNNPNTFWIVARPKPMPAWKRIFPETKPVLPSIRREVYRKRGHILDHGDEEDKNTSPSIP